MINSTQKPVKIPLMKQPTETAAQNTPRATPTKPHTTVNVTAAGIVQPTLDKVQTSNVKKIILPAKRAPITGNPSSSTSTGAAGAPVTALTADPEPQTRSHAIVPPPIALPAPNNLIAPEPAKSDAGKLGSGAHTPAEPADAVPATKPVKRRGRVATERAATQEDDGADTPKPKRRRKRPAELEQQTAVASVGTPATASTAIPAIQAAPPALAPPPNAPPLPNESAPADLVTKPAKRRARDTCNGDASRGDGDAAASKPKRRKKSPTNGDTPAAAEPAKETASIFDVARKAVDDNRAADRAQSAKRIAERKKVSAAKRALRARAAQEFDFEAVWDEAAPDEPSLPPTHQRTTSSRSDGGLFDDTHEVNKEGRIDPSGEMDIVDALHANALPDYSANGGNMAPPPSVPLLDNAVTTYLAWAGTQLGSVCSDATSAAVLKQHQKQATMDDIAATIVPTGPAEDARQLFAAGLRAPDIAHPTHVICSPPCIAGDRCIGRSDFIADGPPGGMVLMAMMSSADLEKHEKRTFVPSKHAFCFLCHLYVVHRFVTAIKFSDVPVRRTCIVSTVAARLSAPPGTAQAADCYDPALVLRPSDTLPCGLSQPIPLLRFECLRWVKYGPRETEWRIDNSAYHPRIPLDPIPRPASNDVTDSFTPRRPIDPSRFFGPGTQSPSQ